VTHKMATDDDDDDDDESVGCGGTGTSWIVQT